MFEEYFKNNEADTVAIFVQIMFGKVTHLHQLWRDSYTKFSKTESISDLVHPGSPSTSCYQGIGKSRDNVFSQKLCIFMLTHSVG